LHQWSAAAVKVAALNWGGWARWKLFTVLIRCLATLFGLERAINVAVWPFMWLYRFRL
jgi:hypothetical protein